MRETRDMLEKAAIYHAASGNARVVLSIAGIADFTPGKHQDLMALIAALLAENGKVTAMEVATEAMKANRELGLYYATQVSEAFYGESEYVARQVHEFAQRDRAQAITARLEQRLQTWNPEEALAEARREFAEWQLNAYHDVPKALSFDELLGLQDDSQPWVIQNMLRRREVMMVTGHEGFGKSMLMAQLTLGAACGVASLSPDGTLHQPAKVFIVDVENTNGQIRENMLKVWPYMQQANPGVQPDILFSQTKAVDLTKATERNALIREITAYKPDLVYLGTVYQLAPSPIHDDVFFAVKNTVDAVRHEIGSAFLVEHHAGHDKDGQGVRDSRPYGSSMWRRWPNFGIGLVPGLENGTRIANLARWRGDRSRGRQIPVALREGAGVPWLPIYEDELEVMQSGAA